MFADPVLRKLLPTRALPILSGLKLEEAQQLFALHGFTVRVVNLDGQPCVVTRDYCPNRINVEMRDGYIVKAAGVG